MSSPTSALSLADAVFTRRSQDDTPVSLRLVAPREATLEGQDFARGLAFVRSPTGPAVTRAPPVEITLTRGVRVHP